METWIRNLESRRLTPATLVSVLDWLARALLVALPALFVVGRSPADFAVSLIAVLFLVNSHLCRSWFWLRTPWVVAALAIWLYLIAISFLADNMEDSLSRSLPFGRFVLFAAALQHRLLLDPAIKRAFLTCLAAVVAFVALDTLIQFVFGQDLFGHVYDGAKLSGPFGEDIPGTFLTKVSFPLLGLGFGFALRTRSRRWIWAFVGLSVALGLIVALTGERSALFTFGLGISVFFLAVPSLRPPMLVAGLASLILLGGTMLLRAELSERLIRQTLEDVDNFWENRYGHIFVRAVGVWQSAPIFGVGLKNFRNACERDHYRPVGPVEEWCFTHPHSIYLEWLSETGAVGFSGFLFLLFLWGREMIHRHGPSDLDQPTEVGLLTALLMFLWPATVSMSFFSNKNAILFWLMLGLALAMCAPRPRPLNPPS